MEVCFHFRFESLEPCIAANPLDSHVAGDSCKIEGLHMTTPMPCSQQMSAVGNMPTRACHATTATFKPSRAKMSAQAFTSHQPQLVILCRMPLLAEYRSAESEAPLPPPGTLDGQVHDASQTL